MPSSPERIAEAERLAEDPEFAFGDELFEIEAAMATARIQSEERRQRAVEERRARHRSVGLIAVGVLGLVALTVLLATSIEFGDSTREDAAGPIPPAPSAPTDRAAGAELSTVVVPASRNNGWAGTQPVADLLADAEKFAAGRQGDVSFAVVEGDGGIVGGRDERRSFPSASVVKSMLLAAELQRLDEEGLPLDPGTRSLLTSMITISDNDAATAIYSRVGDDGLNAIAQRAGMKDFEVAISWGYAEITAGDMALLFAQLDRVMPKRFEEFGKGLLGSVTPTQSWGIPAVADGWSARFKGGWRPTDNGQLVSQAAELRREGEQISLAVLTDGQPSMEYGIESVEGVAKRLLGGS